MHSHARRTRGDGDDADPQPDKGSAANTDDSLHPLAATSPPVPVDVETRALDLAERVTANPAVLPEAIATLLDAVVVTDRSRLSAHVSPAAGADVTTLRIPSPWTAPLLFHRPGRPFTPAETAGAHRLAMAAEMTSEAS